MLSHLRLLLIIAALGLAACSHSPIRLPSSFRPAYNPRSVQLLKAAADEGVFFQINDSVLRDLPNRSAGDQCRRSEDGPWVEQLYTVAEIFQQNPALARKIHIVEFKRGDKTGAEISKDLDGAVTLVLLYAKTESRERINTLSDIPCSAGDMDLIGKDMTVVRFVWPAKASIISLLAGLTDRPAIDRLNVDRKFLQWLAERQAVFRLTPDLAFEKNQQGQPLLPAAFSEFSGQLAQGDDVAALDYWMNEITKRSKLGGSVKFFSLKKNAQRSRGLQVDSLGQFARKLNGYSDPTYPYVSYKSENGGFSTVSLKELNRCLSDLNSTYRSPISLMTTYEMSPESFLFPGYHCADDSSD